MPQGRRANRIVALTKDFNRDGQSKGENIIFPHPFFVDFYCNNEKLKLSKAYTEGAVRDAIPADV